MAYTTITATLPESGQEGDLLRALWHPAYNLVSAKVRGPVGATTANNKNKRVLGQPVVFAAGIWTFCLAAAVGTLNGIITNDGIYDTPIAGADSDNLFSILVRDPALVGRPALPVTDIIGTGIDSNSFVSALAAQCDIICVDGFVATKKQTT